MTTSNKHLVLSLFSLLSLFVLFATASAWEATKSDWWDGAFTLSVLLTIGLYESRGVVKERTRLEEIWDFSEDDETEWAE